MWVRQRRPPSLSVTVLIPLGTQFESQRVGRPNGRSARCCFVHQLAGPGCLAVLGSFAARGPRDLMFDHRRLPAPRSRLEKLGLPVRIPLGTPSIGGELPPDRTSLGSSFPRISHRRPSLVSMGVHTNGSALPARRGWPVCSGGWRGHDRTRDGAGPGPIGPDARSGHGSGPNARLHRWAAGASTKRTAFAPSKLALEGC